MKKMEAVYRNSFRALKRVRTITTVAMLMAVSAALGAFTLNLGPYLKIGFSSLVNEFVCYLFGPVVGAIYGGVLDVVKYIIAPTGPFFPGFTLDAVLAGLIYGSCLYQREFTFKRALITQFFVALICNVILNTFWISVLYGKGFMALLPARIIKNAVMIPVDAGLFYLIVKRMEKGGLLRMILGTDEQKE